jgi:hypothetical protein
MNLSSVISVALFTAYEVARRYSDGAEAVVVASHSPLYGYLNAAV